MTATLHAGRPGQAYDSSWWSAVHALFEEAFPGLPAGIALAASAGARWKDVTTPFALFEDDRCIAHVGVVSHPMVLDGTRRTIAGIHAVCTTADRRRRGHCRHLLTEALAWADRTHDTAKLYTDDPPIYTGHGFGATPTWRFRSSTSPAPDVRRRLLRPSADAHDRALLLDTLAHRTPPSRRCATADPGWVVIIDAALSRRLDTRMWWLPDHEAIVAFDDEGDSTLILEVVARDLPPPEVVRGAAPDPSRPTWWTFSPDRFEPEARAERSPTASGSMTVRGTWPPGISPFGISPLWEH